MRVVIVYNHKVDCILDESVLIFYYSLRTKNGGTNKHRQKSIKSLGVIKRRV